MASKELELWVKALESGEYKQCRQALRTPEGYCCLGVACDLHSKNAEDKVEWTTDALQKFVYDDRRAFLPQRVLDWLGIKGGQEDFLVRMNDRNNNNFKEIAEYIKTNYIKKENEDAK